MKKVKWAYLVIAVLLIAGGIILAGTVTTESWGEAMADQTGSMQSTPPAISPAALGIGLMAGGVLLLFLAFRRF